MIPINKVKDINVYTTICKILRDNGFKRDEQGNMGRVSTGCFFSFESLNKYESVLDFQMEYGYTFQAIR